MNIGLGNRRRTILLIDSDAHARATLRIALMPTSRWERRRIIVKANGPP